MATHEHAKGATEGRHADVTVREATRDDMPHVHRMILELAEYEGVPDGPTLTVADLVEDGFHTQPPWFFVLIAEVRSAGGGEPVGYALCNRAYSSWTRRALYMEDLYVRPEWRRRGVGAALLRHVCGAALRLGAHRIDWHVLESNAPARRFYARLGARDLRLTEGRAALRLDRDRIEAAAAPPAPSPAHAPAPANYSHDTSA